MGKHTVIIEADSAEDLRQRVAETNAVMNPATVSQTVAAPAAKEVAKSGKGGAKTGAKKDEAESPPTAETEADIFGGEPEAAAPPKTYTLPEAQASLKKVVEGKGLPAAKAVLAKFGVAKASDVPEEKRGEFVAACEAAAK